MQPSSRSFIIKFLSPIDFPLLAGRKEVVVVNPFGKRRILEFDFGSLTTDSTTSKVSKDPFGSGTRNQDSRSTHGT